MSVEMRKSEKLRRFESLLDDREDDIPSNIYRELVGIYDELNNAVSELEDELEEIQDK